MNENLKKIMFFSCLTLFVPQIFIAFGVQYSEIYMLQHINVQQKAIVSILGNIFGVIGYWIMSNEIILNYIVNNVRKFLIFEMILYNIGHLLIPDYPWYAMIMMSMNCHLICKVNETMFEDLHNNLFKGRNRTILTTKRRMWKMIGVLTGSGLALVLMELSIQQVVYVALAGDAAVLMMNWLLYKKLK